MFSVTSPSQLPQTPNFSVSLGHFPSFSGAGGKGDGTFGEHGRLQVETQEKKMMLSRTKVVSVVLGHLGAIFME